MPIDPMLKRARERTRDGAKLAAPHILTRLPGSSLTYGPPRKLAPSAAQWTTHWNARCDPAEVAELTWVHDAASMEWSPSVGAHDLDSPRSHAHPAAGFLADGAHPHWPATFALAMPNGRVTGYFGSVITPDDGLLTEASFGFVDDDRHHPVRRQFSLGALERLGGTVATLACGYANAYFHWLFDVLPRLGILRLAGWQANGWDHVVVNGSGAAYEQETMHQFQVPADRIRRVDDRTHIIADRLVVTSNVSDSGFVPAWACQLLRERLLPAAPSAGRPLRLYISRDDAEQRQLADEDRLVSRLDALGFSCLTLSGRPLSEQIDLFSHAEVVVGPHGGGLSNLVWCRPDTGVVEFFADDFVNPVFWGLSKNLDLRHHYVIGRPATPGLPSGYGAMVVDHDAVLRLTEHALEGLDCAEHTDAQ